jgi:hypothetical protein
MTNINRAAVAALILSVLGMSGCVVQRDRGPYTWEHGDRIDRYGHREVGWCSSHGDDEHCHVETR